MADERVELLAELLAKVGGSWYPERTRPALRPISSRHREVAQLILNALERERVKKEEADAPAAPAPEPSGQEDAAPSYKNDDPLYVGATVVYRPPGEKRAVTCRIEKLDYGRAYLIPAPREIGWVSTHTLLPMKSRG